MADVFLSYAREDRSAAERVARALAQCGYDVWWDPDIPAGPNYTQVIEQALTSAKCVLVLWSAASVKSRWVQDEAREGQERDVLVAARLEDVKPPLGFRGHQLADLAAWDQSAEDREFRRLLLGISAHVPTPGPPARELSAPSRPPVQSPREALVLADADVLDRKVVMSAASAAAELAEGMKGSSAGSRPQGMTFQTPLARPLGHGAPPAKSPGFSSPRHESPEVSPAEGSSPRQAARRGLAIAASVAVVLVTGTIMLLRDEGADPPSSGAVSSPASTPPDAESRPSTEPASSAALPNAPPIIGSGAEVGQALAMAADRPMSANAETYLDSSTKLMWTLRDHGRGLNWHEADGYCRDLDLASYTDWRLPSIRELRRLYNPVGRIREPFQIAAPYHLWSSTRVKIGANRDEDRASFFTFDTGKEMDEDLTWDYGAALCVRGPTP